MLGNILRNAEWSQLGALVSPALFDVLPARKLMRRARSILASRNASEYRSALDARAHSLARLPLAVVPLARLSDALPEPTPRDALGSARQAHAQRILTLYFHQLFSGGSCLLDLRASAFRTDVGVLRWSPAPWVAAWDPEFLTALRQIYACLWLWFGQGLRQSFRIDLRSVLIGISVGALMTVATYPLYRAAVALLPWLEPIVAGLYRTSHKEDMGVALAWVIVILSAEELLFRGAWLLALQRRVGKRAALLLCVALYVTAQACTGSWIVALLALCCGTVWTLERMLTGSVVAPLLSHLIWTPTVILLRPVVGAEA